MKISVEKKSSLRKKKIAFLRQKMIEEEKLHINDFIDYEGFLKLYEKYGKGFEEEEFANAFLDLLKHDLYSLKKNRCRILKREEIDEFEIAYLKLNLIKTYNLTKGKEKSYAELKQLYDSTPNKLSFVTFVERVLDVKGHSLACIKNSSKNVTIFNMTPDFYFQDIDARKIERKSREEISLIKTRNKELKELIAQDRNLHIGDKITSDEFYEIYEIYGKEYFSQYDFARIILGLSEGKARGLINRNIENGQIWNEEIVSLEYLYNIRKQIIEKEKLRIKDKIKTYKDFNILFQKYAGILSEQMFAEEILDISKASYKNLKAGKAGVTILTDLEIPDEFWSYTKNQVKAQENVYRGKRIKYEEFIELYKKYGSISLEMDFARKVLDINSEKLNLLKKGKYKTTRILVNNDLDRQEEEYSLEEIKKLRDIVIEENKLHIGQSISGKTFEELYNKYGFKMNKKVFADKILDVKAYRVHSILRDEKDNASILTKEEVGKEYVKNLRNIFLRSNEHYIGDMIDYEEFCRLYDNYSGKLSETQFAEKILFISNEKLDQIKSNRKIKKKTKIFANLKLSDAYIAKLKSKVIEKYLLYYRQNITPGFLRKIYKDFKTIFSEADFVKLILEVEQRQVYYKAFSSKETETFRILSISGTDENKTKFLKWQEKTVKNMLEQGFSYEEIANNTNFTLKALKEKIKSSFGENVDFSKVKRNYVFRRLKSRENIEAERVLELGIDKKYVYDISNEIKEQESFKALEENVLEILEDLKGKASDYEQVRDYIRRCRNMYQNDFTNMSKETLEIINSCLEYLKEQNMENTKFFIEACIAKSDFYKANSFITYSMRKPGISVRAQKTLNELRQHVGYSIKKNRAIYMITESIPIDEIINKTNLPEIEIRRLIKKLKPEKDKNKN